MSVRIVLDARKAEAGTIRDLYEITRRYPGPERLTVECVTSLGSMLLEIEDGVESCWALFDEVRDLGWTAVPDMDA